MDIAWPRPLPLEEFQLNSAIESASPEPLDLEKLRLGISQANIPTLLMVLVQLTADLT